MAKLLVNDNKLNINSGITILNFLNKNGFSIPSQCEMGTCTTCMISILKGQEYLVENFDSELIPLSTKTKNILSCITELNPYFDSLDNIEIYLKI